MSSGADLFVVCKQCGSEVSPYIAECPYCGHRLRRRAPKLPRARTATRSPRGPKRLGRLFGRTRLGRRRALRGDGFGGGGYRWGARPYATIALVSASCAAWVAWHAEPLVYLKMAI